MIYRQDGVTGYFRGLTTTWARDISGYFVFFTAKFKFQQGLDRAPLRITGEAFGVGGGWGLTGWGGGGAWALTGWGWGWVGVCIHLHTSDRICAIVIHLMWYRGSCYGNKLSLRYLSNNKLIVGQFKPRRSSSTTKQFCS